MLKKLLRLPRGRRAGQAALEFLMTYGWAILAVLMIISALAYFGVLNPVNYMPERCTLGTGFDCKDIAVGADGANILIQNSLPQPYVITAASITANGQSCSAGMNQAIGGGDSATLSIPSCSFSLLSGKKRVAINITYHDVGSTFSHSLLGDAITSIAGTSYFMPGDALAFDGSNQTVMVQNFSYGVMQQGEESASWTLAVWAKQTANNGNEKIMLGRQGCNGGIYTWNGGYAFAIKTNQCWTNAQTIADTPANMSAWHYLVAVYANRTMIFYVDGAQAGNATFSATMNPYGTALAIGGQGLWFFDGELDEPRVYDRALSGAEISAQYNSGTGQYGGPEPGLVGGWHFDEGNGTIAHDYSGNGNDGTLTNMNPGTAWVQGIVEKP